MSLKPSIIIFCRTAPAGNIDFILSYLLKRGSADDDDDGGGGGGRGKKIAKKNKKKDDEDILLAKIKRCYMLCFLVSNNP